jgi:regulator of sigma E protease
MIFSGIYIIFAILALSFLIFIHELGHYFMARWVGMRVETFAIGFGKPIYSWVKDGVKWQIGWLLFGGYVKIAGMDNEGDQEPYDVKDGFFSKKPLDRILVAFMGPFVNIVFALLIFCCLWAAGGRLKNFGEYTPKIGWVDQDSELYADGIRPGDEVSEYNNHEFQGTKDHLYAPMTGSANINVRGMKVNYAADEKVPFDYTVKTYPHPHALQKGILTSGILNSANYVIYDRFPDGSENPLPEGSPMLGSGIEYGDRILWVDGEVIFSAQQLDHILNDNKAFLTIQRGNQILQRRVPRVEIQEMKLNPQIKEELVDWQYESGLNTKKIQNLYLIPYSISNDLVVQDEIKFIDKENQQEAFPKNQFSSIETPLESGDKIIAINGEPVAKASELLRKLQQQRINIIVQRDPELKTHESWKQADQAFDDEIDLKEIQKIARTIGTDHPAPKIGGLVLLKPIIPKMRSEFASTPEKQAMFATELLQRKKEVEAIDDPEKRAHALHLLVHSQHQFLIGLPVQDRKVEYNPAPFALFTSVSTEIWRTLTALFTGSMNPKWLSGPIGIVQVVYDSWLMGFKDVLFWLGAISLNLGILNLMPIPVLDGGTIVISLFEMITGKRIHPKTLEKVIIPFAVILIGFFIFFTYNDVSRLFESYFQR